MTAEQYLIEIQAKPDNMETLWEKLPHSEQERLRKAMRIVQSERGE